MITIQNVSKSYGTLKAVDDLSFSVNDGEILVFLGPNGAGKSTTLKMLTGILPIDQGDILVDGHSIKSEPLEAKKHFAFVPDDPNVFPRLRGREYLDFLINVYELPNNEELKKKRLDLLNEFSLFSAMNDYIGNYSHGMKQKLLVVGVLLLDPQNWILDEPMTGLDPQSSFLLKGKMREQASHGKSVLFSTHVLEVAEKLCDRIGIIDHGKLLYLGTLEELKKKEGENLSLESLFLELTK